MITYGRHHPEIRLTIPPCRKPIPLRSHMAALPELTFDPPKTSDEGFGQWPLRRGVSAVPSPGVLSADPRRRRPCRKRSVSSDCGNLQ